MLLIGNSLTFQRQLWQEKKPIFRSEFERGKERSLQTLFEVFFSVTGNSVNLCRRILDWIEIDYYEYGFEKFVELIV